MAFETGLRRHDWQGLLLYADWLAENGCPAREAEVRAEVAEYRRLMTATRNETPRPDEACVAARVLAEMAAAGV
jgi:uncharacterized protein (TIGR02996 family)